jgi:GNAT superfamily N-acetyltransferase
MNISITTYSGQQIEPYLASVARLRIQVFRAYPYLYDGDPDYEREYLQTYLQQEDAIVVIARDGDEIVGASTAIPMAAETENVKAPFIAAGYDIDKIYYFGESVLNDNYRRQGIGVGFFEHRERKARTLDRFQWLTFCGVVRPDNHPLRPDDYLSLDHFWRRRGFQATDLYCTMRWKEITEAEESEKNMRFWMKEVVKV